jgi:hypothetical protein
MVNNDNEKTMRMKAVAISGEMLNDCLIFQDSENGQE